MSFDADSFMEGIAIGMAIRKSENRTLPFIVFTSPSSFTIGVYNSHKNWDGTLEYSTDRSTWTEWDGTGTISSGTKGILYMRGSGNTEITGDYLDVNWVMTGSSISAIGNIESLLDWETVTAGGHPTMAPGCFKMLFKNCTALIKAPELPATELRRRCYYQMFRECTSLTEAPKLPATTLATSCYYGMFYGCSSLAEAPALPATTLASSCYYGMFHGCTSLTAAPALPATTMDMNTSCYYQMFYGCSSLAEAPALPATTLALYCYYEMFHGCTSLTAAPALPATTMDSGCYYQMFYGCSSLAEAPALPATTLATSCYYGMFYGCSSLAEAPALPATTLADFCYSSMFRGCSSLVSLPRLSAENMPYRCYSAMFYNCTGIKISETQTAEYANAYRLPEEGTGTAGTNATSNMFANTGGIFTGTPAINTTYYTSNTIVS